MAYPYGTVLSTVFGNSFMENPDPNKIGRVLREKNGGRTVVVRTAAGTIKEWDWTGGKQWDPPPSSDYSKLKSVGLESVYYATQRRRKRSRRRTRSRNRKSRSQRRSRPKRSRKRY
jgi:hypothetical protein